MWKVIQIVGKRYFPFFLPSLPLTHFSLFIISNIPSMENVKADSDTKKKVKMMKECGQSRDLRDEEKMVFAWQTANCSCIDSWIVGIEKQKKWRGIVNRRSLWNEYEYRETKECGLVKTMKMWEGKEMQKRDEYSAIAFA